MNACFFGLSAVVCLASLCPALVHAGNGTDVKRTLINHYEWQPIRFDEGESAKIASLLAAFAVDRIYVTGSSPYRWKVIQIFHFMQSDFHYTTKNLYYLQVLVAKSTCSKKTHKYVHMGECEIRKNAARFICEFTMNRNFSMNEYKLDKSTCYPESITPIGWALYTM